MQIIEFFKCDTMYELYSYIEEYCDKNNCEVYTMNTVFKGTNFFDPVQSIVIFKKEDENI